MIELTVGVLKIHNLQVKLCTLTWDAICFQFGEESF